ncbi:MAG TPA: universal stress protein [Candidatus Binatia bacterium]|jgi:nucleotide-binding universal stress UspA family protein
MPKFKKIVASTDLSKLSLVGVRYAMELGREQEGTVILCHVIDSEGEWFGGRDDLNPAGALLPRQKQRLVEFIKDNCADLLGKVEVRQVVDLGVPYKKIIERAEKEAADLIVISTHGRTGLDQFMVGSVAQRVVARAPCPVLSIRPNERRRGKKVVG